MRCLYRVDDDELVADARTRRDFFRASDDVLQVHESHDLLVAVSSGVVLAHRTGDVYYSPETGGPLYQEAPNLFKGTGRRRRGPGTPVSSSRSVRSADDDTTNDVSYG